LFTTRVASASVSSAMISSGRPLCATEQSARRIADDASLLAPASRVRPRMTSSRRVIGAGFLPLHDPDSGCERV
jgi:hypothetical protein